MDDLLKRLEEWEHITMERQTDPVQFRVVLIKSLSGELIVATGGFYPTLKDALLNALAKADKWMETSELLQTT